MFDRQKFEEIPKYASFNFWFERVGLGRWYVIDKTTTNIVGVVKEKKESESLEIKDTDLLVSLHSEDANHVDSGETELREKIAEDFIRFKDRPEYAVGHIMFLNDTSNQDYNIEACKPDTLYTLKDKYERLIVGTAFVRAMKSGKCTDPDKVFDKIERCLNWLRETDFYVGPASSIYHDSCPGGLLKHTLNVYNNAIILAETHPFRNCKVDSIALTTLCHDWCKIGLYEVYLKNVKDEKTGVWNKVEAYRKNQKGIPLGHGAASMYLASRFFNLSSDESLAIRWHMGPWKCHDSEHDELQMSNEKFPLVHLVQFADQLSITEYSQMI